MKKLLLVLFFVPCLQQCFGQYYQKSVGLKLGESSGISYRVFKMEEKATEYMLVRRNGGVQLMVLREQFEQSKLGENLFLFYGLGGQIGVESHLNGQVFTSLGNRNNRPENSYGTNVLVKYGNHYPSRLPNYFTMGINAIFGAEYRLNAPITIGLDIKPRISWVNFDVVAVQLFDISFSVALLL